MPKLRAPAACSACALLLAVALAAPAAAGNRSRNPAGCVNIAHQLVHYDTMRARAAKANNALWVGRIDAQIDRLEDQLAMRCPDEAAKARKDKQLAEFLKLAARSALTFFTLGAY